MESFSSTLFKKWYKNNRGSSVTIDSENRKIQVFDSKGNSIAILFFAGSIDSEFDLADLFKEDLKAGDYEYHVFPDLSYAAIEDTLWRIEVLTDPIGYNRKDLV